MYLTSVEAVAFQTSSFRCLSFAVLRIGSLVRFGTCCLSTKGGLLDDLSNCWHRTFHLRVSMRGHGQAGVVLGYVELSDNGNSGHHLPGRPS
jgi:hypothetical protein